MFKALLLTTLIGLATTVQAQQQPAQLPLPLASATTNDGVSIRAAVKQWPKEYLRTTKALVVPPQHKKTVSLEVWTTLLSGVADIYTTQYEMNHDCHCYESNFLYGKHPSSGRLWGEGMGFVLTETMLVEAIHRVGEPAEGHIGAAIAGVWHGVLAYHNMQQPRKQ